MKRQKNDAIDAEAICEAAQRPSMRFVAVKSEQQQAAGLVFRTRDLLVRQRTQLINAIRGHLTEYGWIAPKGPSHVAMLADLLEEEEMASSLPEAARAMFRLMLDPARRPQRQDRGSRQGDRAACSRGRSIAQANDRSWHRRNDFIMPTISRVRPSSATDFIPVAAKRSLLRGAIAMVMKSL